MAADERDGTPGLRRAAASSATRAKETVARLIGAANAGALVRALPVQELYYLIREIGVADAETLIELARPEQVRGFLDFDLWQGDRLAEERAHPWLDALLDLGPIKTAEVVRALDAEVAALLLQRQARIYDLSLEAPPPDPEGHFYPTPDGAFLLDVLPAGDAGRRVERLVDWLYRADLIAARQVIAAARWELPSDLEEWAYRWRSGRMADLGFPDPAEAAILYRYLDPATVSLEPDEGEGSGALVPTAGEGNLFQRLFAAVGDEDERARLQAEAVLLANQVMVAERLDPADVEAAGRAAERMSAYLSLGLEYLGRGRRGMSSVALRTVPLQRIFRVGASLTIKVKRAADTLVSRGWVGLVPGQATLLDEPLRGQVEALRRTRPEYPRSLDGGAGTRPFETLAELARAATAIERAAAMEKLVRDGLGVPERVLAPDALAGCVPEAAKITFRAVGATLIGNLLLERPATMVPLLPRDLAALRSTALLPDEAKLRPSARLIAVRGLEEKLADRERQAPEGWEAIVDDWLEGLARALAPSVIGAPGWMPEMTEGVIVRVRPAA